MIHRIYSLVIILLLFSCNSKIISQARVFEPLDVFNLQWINHPQISPNGQVIVYERCKMNITTDSRDCHLWYYSLLEKTHRKLTSLQGAEYSPIWSPSGNRIAFLRKSDEGIEIFIIWWDSKTAEQISNLESNPSNITWSPDGNLLAFQMFTQKNELKLYKTPKKPKGAKWAPAPRVTTRLKHEADGRGYLKAGQNQIYLVSAHGGPIKKLTHGNTPRLGPLSWSNDQEFIYFTSKDSIDAEYKFRESNIYRINIKNRDIDQLTAFTGPFHSPIVSPKDGRIAFLGYEDKFEAYQHNNIYTMTARGENIKKLPLNKDVSPSSIRWNSNGENIYFLYDDHGKKVLGKTNLKGKVQVVSNSVGGTSIGRPYTSGNYSINTSGDIAFTHSTPYAPAELSIYKGGKVKQLSSFNSFFLEEIKLGQVEEINYTSSVDNLSIQGWIVKPPNYREGHVYPLIVENHGGPILSYGPSFSPEMQIMASAGYIVFYPNPRGSTGYGEDFSNALYRNYPGEDYNDVMDGVDYLLRKGLTSEDSLFVTGGSAGGIMTAWIIGKNNRFESAAVIKPVMNWFSKTLTADNYYYYANARYDGQPFENPVHYYKFSPISLVQNIETPTLVMVGLKDLRTPPSEAKQLYHALKLRKIETAYVEIPEASHFIAKRPSQMLAKIQCILNWFNKKRAVED